MPRKIVNGEAGLDLPGEAANVVGVLAGQLLRLHAQLRKLDLRLAALKRSDERARRLATIPGIGPIGATAIAASVSDPAQFKSGRQFAAWLGLTPSQRTSGGKERLGRITKMGNAYRSQLLVTGATALIRYAKSKPKTFDPRFVALLAKKPAQVQARSSPWRESLPPSCMQCLNPRSCSKERWLLRRKCFVGKHLAGEPVPTGRRAEPFRSMRCTGLLPSAPPTWEGSVLRRPTMRRRMPTAKTTLNPAYNLLKNCLPNSMRLDDPITQLQPFPVMVHLPDSGQTAFAVFFAKTGNSANAA